ncbi:MAG: 50S ribosomal protein L6 [Victivallales bacterium]|nr:50S ribosomal protein L6 [Victivallales bacterium]
MSRIGNKVIKIPAGVKVEVKDGVVAVEGKAKLALDVPARVSVNVAGDEVSVVRNDASRESNALQGLARSLINNMMIGVTAGFKKELTIIGVGYRAQVNGQKMTLNLGYSHPVEYQIPAGIKVSVADNTKVTIEGADKQLVGEVAATIRKFRKPEPYKGKGIRYNDERVVIKVGKSAGK